MQPTPDPADRPTGSLADWEVVYEGLPSGFQAPYGDRAAGNEAAGRGAAAYGEITEDGVALVMRWLAPHQNDVLVDLGSGTGRLLVQAVCTTPVGHAVGVELSDHRHATARAAHAKLQAIAPRAAARLVFHHADVRQFDWRNATLVWLGSTCFPPALLDQIARHAVEAPGLRRLLTTRPLESSGQRGLTELGQFEVDATWTTGIPVHAYARRD